MDGGLPANWIGASGTGSRPAAMVTPRLVFRVDGSSLHRHQAANEPEGDEGHPVFERARQLQRTPLGARYC